MHNKKSIADILKNCVWIIWGVFFVYTFGCMLFLKKIIEMPSTNATNGHNIIYFLIAFVISFIMFILLKGIWKTKTQMTERKFWICMLVCTVLLYVIQLIVIKCIWFETGWDVTCVYYDAVHRAEDGVLLGSHGYFTKHPNNLFITFIFAVVDKILCIIGIHRYYLVLCCLGAFLINIAGVLAIYIAKKLSQSYRTAVVIWGIYAFFIALSPWMCVPYTDVYAIFFPIAIYALYLAEPKKKWMNILRWIFIGFLTVVGYYIKPTASIITMAIAIDLILKILDNKQEWKRPVFSGIIIASGCLLGLGFYKFGSNYMGFVPDEDEAFPVAHYLMLGQNDRTYGSFAGEDWTFITSYDTKEEKVKYSLEGAKERFTARGIKGNIRFFSIKNMVNYDNATFSWAYEGEFFKDISSGTTGLCKVLKSIYYPDGEHYKTYATICQGIWLIIILGCIGILWDKNKRQMLVPCMAIIGLTIFLLIFESRGRYLFLYTPVYVTIGCLGMKNIYSKIWEKINGMFKHSDCA